MKENVLLTYPTIIMNLVKETDRQEKTFSTLFERKFFALAIKQINIRERLVSQDYLNITRSFIIGNRDWFNRMCWRSFVSVRHWRAISHSWLKCFFIQASATPAKLICQKYLADYIVKENSKLIYYFD